MSKNLSTLNKGEDPAGYAKLANEGIMVGYPVKINGVDKRADNGIHYHSTVKFFDPLKDHPHAIHEIAQHLPLNPPDAKNTQIEPGQFKDRLGNDVYVIKMKGNSADKLKEHNGKFAHLGYPTNYEYTPHVSVDKAMHDKIKASGAKTAHEAGIEFGHAELKHGPKTLKVYKHPHDNAGPTVPDHGDVQAQLSTESTLPKIAASEKQICDLHKGALKNAGIALGMAAGLAAPTHAAHHPSASPVVQHKSYDHGKMLRAISSVESSGGTNTNHKAMSNGQHAYGKFALTPDTIRDTIKSQPDLKSKHARALALQGDTIHRYMQDNKGLEDVIADRHLQHLEQHFGNDPETLGFGWLNGVSGTNKAKKNKVDFKKHWYASKIRNAYGKD